MREHGLTKYKKERCRCDICVVANRIQSRTDYRRRAKGEHVRIDALYTRRHLQKLSRAGISQKRIEQLIGLGHNTQSLIRTGKRTRVMRKTQQAVLSLDPTDPTLLPPGAVVDATPLHAAIGRLVNEYGWTKTAINRQILGAKSDGIQIGRSGRCRRRHLDAILAALDAEDANSQRGIGRLVCVICQRPYRDHKLTETCLESRRRASSPRRGKLTL